MPSVSGWNRLHSVLYSAGELLVILSQPIRPFAEIIAANLSPSTAELYVSIFQSCEVGIANAIYSFK